MASKSQPLILLLSSLLTLFSFTINSSHAATGDGEIAIYWGQNNGDGDLTTTCDTGNYKIVNLAFLNKFGDHREVGWNFANHCGGPGRPCSILAPGIKHCQDRGVKVLLSIGGAIGDYSLSSPEDAKDVANYLYINFLSDLHGDDAPLGKAILNGIDFAIGGGDDKPKRFKYWEYLVKELDDLRKPNHKFYLSATPQCHIPDKHLHKAIKTGLFDYIFVQFYNDAECEYDSSTGSTKALFESWDAWTRLASHNNEVFLGVPAGPLEDPFDPQKPFRGFIPVKVMNDDVLRHIKNTPKYGGVVLWDRYLDVYSKYSTQIKPHVPKHELPLQSVTAVSDAIY